MQAKSKPSPIRSEPPTLDEAIFAAQGLADDVEGQTEIAAMLMGLQEAEVRAAVLKAAAAMSGAFRRLPASSRPMAGRQTVVVERRTARALTR